MATQLIDKLVLWLLCMLSLMVYGINMGFVAACLLSILITLLCFLEKISETVMNIIIIAYLITILWIPEFVAFLPVIMYDISYKKMKIPFGIAVIMFVCAIFSEKDLMKTDYYMPLILGVVFAGIFSVLSVLLQFRTGNYLEVQDRLLKIRDDATESNLRLKLKNNELLEKQDYEIHVATLQERNRIAREIHDNVGHMLTRAILQTGALKAIVKDEVIKPQIVSLNETLNIAMTNIRTSVHDLHDESVDLKSALEELIAKLPNFKTGLEYSVEHDVPQKIKYCFIAVVKEGLNNAVKYSNGNKINVIVREQPAFYQLIVEDNGTDIPNDFIGGIGISNMRERVRNLNGNFNISTSNGFRINISIMK